MLPGSAEIEQCLSGPEGILSVDAPDQVLVDLTTSYPVKTKQLAESAAARGRAYLDAGMFVMDISDKSKPKPISRFDNSPPYTGFTHTIVRHSSRSSVQSMPGSWVGKKAA